MIWLYKSRICTRFPLEDFSCLFYTQLRKTLGNRATNIILYLMCLLYRTLLSRKPVLSALWTHFVVVTCLTMFYGPYKEDA